MIKVHLHLGAHKTATTSLQEVLRMNKKYLSEKGIYYFPREKFRDLVSRPHFYPKMLPSTIDKTFIDVLKEQNDYQGETKVIVSEENLIALVQEVLTSKGFYKNIESRFKRINKFFSDVNVEAVYFTTRSYDEFLPSIYVQMNRALNFKSFDSFMGRTSLDKLDWYDVVERIKNGINCERLIVEDFKSILKKPENYYDDMIFGVPYSSLKGLDKYLNDGISNEAVMMSTFLSDEIGVTVTPKVFNKLSSLFPTLNYGKFTPIKGQLKQQMREKYQADVERIKSSL